MKKAGNDKGYVIAKGPPASTENSPVISEPVLVSTHSNGTNAELEKGNSSSLGSNALPASQVAENQGGPVASSDPEKFREEQAVIKAQAAFRGFLVGFYWPYGFHIGDISRTLVIFFLYCASIWSFDFYAHSSLIRTCTPISYILLYYFYHLVADVCVCVGLVFCHNKVELFS